MTGKVKEPKTIALQPRDKAIMIFVSEFRLLSRDQLQKLLEFSCTSKMNFRLKKLYDHGYLSRKFLPIPKGRPKAFYSLGSKGLGTVSEILGLDLLLLKRERLAGERDLFLKSPARIE